MPTFTKVLGYTAVGCLVIAGILVVALILSFDSCFGEPEGIAVTVEAPLKVMRGSRFTVLASVENHSTETRTLVDIDVADEYLKGIAIETTEPPFQSAEHVPIDNTVSHSFDIAIPANGKVEVRFATLAAHPGDFAGDLDFCIDTETRCTSRNVRTIVEP
jgi:hypothetical protein